MGLRGSIPTNADHGKDQLVCRQNRGMGVPSFRPALCRGTPSNLAYMIAARCPPERVMSERIINQPTLPFSCPFRATKGGNAVQAGAKRKPWKSLRNGENWTVWMICKDLHKLTKTAAQGSGPGGRWFESTRPDQSFQLLTSVKLPPKLIL